MWVFVSSYVASGWPFVALSFDQLLQPVSVSLPARLSLFVLTLVLSLNLPPIFSQVKDTWAVIEEMDFPRLSKLTLPNIGEAEDVLKCGSLEFYDKTYDRVNTKTERRLQRVNRVFHKVSEVYIE